MLASTSARRRPISRCRKRSTRRIFCSENPLRRSSAITVISTTSAGEVNAAVPLMPGGNDFALIPPLQLPQTDVRHLSNIA